MKALSLKQPWAELILQDRKTIEIRKWNTRFRGRFLIHASLQPNKGQLERFGIVSPQLGSIVGEAELVDVIMYATKEAFDADFDKHLATTYVFDKKLYGFVLKNVKRVTPKQLKGRLNFFEVPW